MPSGILVVGDSILDRYVQGSITRPCPEGAHPLVDVESEWDAPGGAANVAANIVSLGSPAYLATVLGTGAASAALRTAIIGADVYAAFGEESHHHTPMKTRILAGGRTLARYDTGQGPVSDPARMAAAIEGVLADPSIEIRAIVVADYLKGAMTEDLALRLLALAGQRHLPIFIDARPQHVAWYRGASLYKPNFAEAMGFLLLAGSVHPGLSLGDWRSRAEVAVREVRNLGNFGAVVLTCGQHGAVISAAGGEPWLVPSTSPQAVSDPTGAGDTFLAALVVACTEGMGLAQAVQFANAAAGIAVQSPGTLRVSRDAVDAVVRRERGPAGKVVDLQAALRRAQAVKKAEGRVGLVSIAFDFHGLQASHIAVLQRAREHADFVCVGVCPGAGASRLAQLSLLDCVDAVFYFNGNVEELVRHVRPDVLVADQTALVAGAVPGADFVAAQGGRVEFVAAEEVG